ncbi:MerR family DNA-binding transcriptional regulator [Streptomyces bambusae]|uniref:MerR family DNA-binding transcriptional regulator n=1 Tax=Streptomyces bambusae TaxID=1550616 RepID=A0ABS6ZBW1_9ACTN|nr:MerR family DNA-binding transcriptional regulator [Streptomyces bambusae]
MLIGDVALRCGVSARMLRHYESLGLLQPTGRTEGGYRKYSGEDIRRIFHIESLRSLGLPLRDVARALDDPGFTPSELIDDLVRRTRERIEAETELLTRLGRIGAAEPARWDDVLRTIALLNALGSESAGKRQRAALSAAEGSAVPVGALVEAALNETDPNVAGALRWALARSGSAGLALLAEGLASSVAESRRRAVEAVAEIPDPEATALLRDALADPDVVVRGRAALALGARGVADAVPTLTDMIVEEANDVDAADALSGLAHDRSSADRIVAGLLDRLGHDTVGPPARLRLTQALADIPGDAASRALAELSHDEDRAVALTAAYVIELRHARQRSPAGPGRGGRTCENARPGVPTERSRASAALPVAQYQWLACQKFQAPTGEP